jgi:hypothetical protein
MNPREKAVEIVSIYLSKWLGNDKNCNIYVINNIPAYGIFEGFESAKECALVHVDSMLEQVDWFIDSYCYEEAIDYLTDVKSEIENL